MYIKLTQNFYAEIDEEDYSLVARYKWHVTSGGKDSCRYARTNVGSKQIYMHRLLMPDVQLVDHVDRNGLNNKRVNLRPATQTQNSVNIKKNRRNTSGYRGVHKHKLRWKAMIGYKGKTLYLGLRADIVEAAVLYDLKAVELYGKYAVLNFPEEK